MEVSSRKISVLVPDDHGATDIISVEDNNVVVRPHRYPEDTYPAVWYHFRVKNLFRFRLKVTVKVKDLPKSPPGFKGLMYEPFWISSLWSSDRKNWTRIPNEKQILGEDWFQIEFSLRPSEEVWIAETYPVTYQNYISFIEDMSDLETSTFKREKIKLGVTLEKRPIYALRITNPSSHPKYTMLFISGQHAVEESGKIFTRTVTEWLSKNYNKDPAQRILDKYEIYIVPLVNPDGCYHGRMNTNAKGQNPLLDHHCIETRSILKLIDEISPHILINAHGWGNLMGKPPHEGWYHWKIDRLYEHMKKHMYGVNSVDWGLPDDRHILKEEFKIEYYAHKNHNTQTGILEINWNSYKPSPKKKEVKPTLQNIKERSLQYFKTATSMLIE